MSPATSPPYVEYGIAAKSTVCLPVVKVNGNAVYVVLSFLAQYPTILVIVVVAFLIGAIYTLAGVKSLSSIVDIPLALVLTRSPASS